MRCADFKTSYIADETIFQSLFVKFWIGVLIAVLVIVPFFANAYVLYIANLIGFAVVLGFTGKKLFGLVRKAGGIIKEREA